MVGTYSDRNTPVSASLVLGVKQHEETTHLKQHPCAFQAPSVCVLPVLRMNGQVRVSLLTLTLPSNCWDESLP